MKKYFLFVPVAMALLSLNACEDKFDTLDTASISDYNPLAVGKYITYQLDSTVFTNFGTNLEVHSYQVKHLVEAEITDNLGRPSYRIVRFIRNSPTGTWMADNTFMTTNTGSGLEFVENNLRYIKLRTPFRDFYSWKGNTYIDTYSLNSDFQYMDDWDYTYDSVGAPLSIGSFNFDNAVKVDHIDEVAGSPDNPSAYYQINYSSEKYAKGLGLVYRNFFHAVHQPPTPGNGAYFEDGSYGVTLAIIDHN